MSRPEIALTARRLSSSHTCKPVFHLTRELTSCACVLIIPFTGSNVDVHDLLLLLLFRIPLSCSPRVASTIFIECFPSFGAEMQAVPLPLLPHCFFFLFFSFLS